MTLRLVLVAFLKLPENDIEYLMLLQRPSVMKLCYKYESEFRKMVITGTLYKK